MARSTPNQYLVVLTDEQRPLFLDITRNGHAPAKKIRHAQLLLLSDHGREGGPVTLTQIAELLQVHPNSVDKIRKRFVLQGETPLSWTCAGSAYLGIPEELRARRKPKKP